MTQIVPFSVSRSTAALSLGKPASAETYRGSCLAQGHKDTYCMLIFAEIAQCKRDMTKDTKKIVYVSKKWYWKHESMQIHKKCLSKLRVLGCSSTFHLHVCVGACSRPRIHKSVKLLAVCCAYWFYFTCVDCEFSSHIIKGSDVDLSNGCVKIIERPQRIHCWSVTFIYFEA